MTPDQFEGAVEAAIDAIPDELLDELDNVIFVVEDEPSDEQRAGAGRDNASYADDELLGLYEGLPLTERDGLYGTGELPDVITIFRGPHERCFGAEGDRVLRSEIARTVMHEVGHHFGNDEETLSAMGL